MPGQNGNGPKQRDNGCDRHRPNGRLPVTPISCFGTANQCQFFIAIAAILGRLAPLARFPPQPAVASDGLETVRVPAPMGIAVINTQPLGGGQVPLT